MTRICVSDLHWPKMPDERPEWVRDVRLFCAAIIAMTLYRVLWEGEEIPPQ